MIELDGTDAGGHAEGLFIAASDCIVQGLVINRFDGHGIEIDSGENNTIRGNFIGVGTDGATKLGNGRRGVEIDSSNNTVGGVLPGDRNVISGNGGSGIEIEDTAAGTIVQGNFIGTDAAGVTAVGNGSHGLTLDDCAGNTIGGTASGAGNLIAYNHKFGVHIRSGSGNPILGNSIHSNEDLGIELGDDDVTPNDDGDPDLGPNNLQNYPVLTSVSNNAPLSSMSPIGIAMSARVTFNTNAPKSNQNRGCFPKVLAGRAPSRPGAPGPSTGVSDDGDTVILFSYPTEIRSFANILTPMFRPSGSSSMSLNPRSASVDTISDA